MFIVFLLIVSSTTASAESIPEITTDVTTEFGTYQPVIVDVNPSVTPYQINSDLSNVSNISEFELAQEAIDLLSSNGFAAEASYYRQIYDVYNECEDNGIPAFVTTDACLHTYHILYDYMLRVLEVNFFIDDLNNLTQTMLDASQEVYNSASEPLVKEAALDNISYFSVAYGLLNPEMSNIPSVAAGEIGLISDGSSGYVASPLFYSDDYPYLEDYSQYKPRGHYTRTTELEQFFRAMMWYGRITYSLNLEGATQEGLRQAARQALLIARILESQSVGDEPASTVWERIYEPTVFFVGKMDDINYLKYLEIAEEIFGEDFLSQSPDVLADDTDIDAFITEALNLPDPKITVKAGKGLRFMGQRYIPDSYILDQLVFDGIPDTRFMPRGLDVMAVLGSDRAYDIIETYYDDTVLYPGYVEKVPVLKEEFMGYTPYVWAQNLYFNWLYTLAPLLDVKGEGYPPFMQSGAWVDKDLNTALGSWAELRHDTILYAKESETRETSMPPAPPLVMGYVEPNPEVYARLAALAGFMSRGLENRELLDELFESRLSDFEALMISLKDISVKELQETLLSNDEYALICNFGGTIEALTSFPPEFEAQYENEADDFMAVIADVHTDTNFNECLEVGVGHPLNLYVIAPVNGIPTLTKGSIFSYHEFKQPLADGRLSDEEWQELQSGADAKAMPEWSENFLAGESSKKTETYHFPPNELQVTLVEDNTPATFNLFQNHPNPFNPATTINYSLNEGGQVRLEIYNLSGQLVEVLVDRWQNKGLHRIEWKPDGIASGIYFVRITQNKNIGVIKTLFIK